MYLVRGVFDVRLSFLTMRVHFGRSQLDFFELRSRPSYWPYDHVSEELA